VIVVSDASPIIGLSAIGLLDLLQDLYQSVLVPEAVYREVTKISGLPGAKEIEAAQWIRRHALPANSLVTALTTKLDLGESEAIALALEQKADLLLMDERQGRYIARRMGLEVIGVLGALVEAKHRNHLAKLKPALDELASTAGFRVSGALYQKALTIAGE